jgi:ribosomal protein L35
MKLKTNKAVRKRIKLTGGKKVKKIKIRAGGQDHFNSRESGKVTKNKRRDKTMSSVNTRNLRILTPYN